MPVTMKSPTPFSATSTPIAGLYVLHLDVRPDNRGWFKENWQREKIAAIPELSQACREFRPVQNNISFNAQPGVTRGLHAEPWNKFVTIAQGEVFGVWCDLRADSPTFGKVFSTRITTEQAVFVPRGVANGFQALEPSIYTYLVDAHWSPQAHYSHVNLADPALGICWPIPLDKAEISAADRTHPLLADATAVPPGKILITGADGQVGRALATQFPDATLCNHSDFDLTADYQALEDAVNWDEYAVIINAAAYTAVDHAEMDRARCWAVNAAGPAKLARLATNHDLTVVHFSTDYVFSGDAPGDQDETTPIAPSNFYGASKAAGDAAIALTTKHYIVRTSWVVGDGKNFVTTMVRLAQSGAHPAVVNDQVGRLTFSTDIAQATAHLLAGEHPYGVYGFSNSGQPQSWAQIARRVFEIVQVDPNHVTECSTEEYTARVSAQASTASPTPTAPATAAVPTPVLAVRPKNSCLSLAKIEATGFIPPLWEARLEEYVRNLVAPDPSSFNSEEAE